MLEADGVSTTRRPSSVIHNVIDNPDAHGQDHRHYRHSRHSHDGREEAAGSHRMQHHFPKIFSKEGIKNALFINSATSAFHKGRNLESNAMYAPAAALAITGSAVPAMWMRRDDKGRRPVRFLFLCTNYSFLSLSELPFFLFRNAALYLLPPTFLLWMHCSLTSLFGANNWTLDRLFVFILRARFCCGCLDPFVPLAFSHFGIWVHVDETFSPNHSIRVRAGN